MARLVPTVSILATLLLLMAACADGPTEPTAPSFTMIEASGAHALVTTPGFSFLPPTVTPPVPPWDGTFDPGLVPTIVVCRIDGADPIQPGDCPHPPVATLPGSGPPEHLRVDPDDGAYLIGWHSTDALVTGEVYRAFVSVAPRVLGYVDLLTVSKKPNKVPAGYTGIVPGHPFLFKFRVSTGVPGSLVLEPVSVELLDTGAEGLGVDFTATLTDLHGDPLVGAEVSWTSGDPSLFSMDPPSSSTDGSGLAPTRAVLVGSAPAPTDVTITAAYGDLTATATVTLIPSTGPFAVPDAYATYEGVELEVEGPGLLANDFDYEGEALRLLTATGPANGSITALVTNGRFGYLPDPGFIGTDMFTYVMEDASGNRSTPGTVTIEVLPDPNLAPVAVGDGYSTLEGVELEVEGPGLLANDFDYEGGALRLLTATGPAHGSITALVTNGRFGYLPDPGFTGTDMFTYVMEDASGKPSTPGVVTILVLPPDGVDPVAVPDAYATYEGVELEVEGPGLLANDFDYDGETLRLLTATGPAHGSITALVTNGHFGYLPDPGFVGTDMFTYVMEDASGKQSSPGVVTVLVLPAPPDP